MVGLFNSFYSLPFFMTVCVILVDVMTCCCLPTPMTLASVCGCYRGGIVVRDVFWR